MIARRVKPMLWAALATATLGTAASAAQNLPPNSDLNPVPLGSVAGETLVADTGLTPFIGKNALNEINFTGKYEQWVYRTGGGTLDFVTEVMNDMTSMDGITEVSLTNYTGFTTDAFYNPLNLGDIAPTDAERQTSGDTVGFFFPHPNGIGNGAESALLIVKTDAKLYTSGTINMIDGAVSTNPAFAPVVPEPGSLALLATGGLPLLGFLRRRKRA